MNATVLGSVEIFLKEKGLGNSHDDMLDATTYLLRSYMERVEKEALRCPSISRNNSQCTKPAGHTGNHHDYDTEGFGAFETWSAGTPICISCGKSVNEVCRDGFCRACHVDLTFEDCMSGAWSKGMQLKEARRLLRENKRLIEKHPDDFGLKMFLKSFESHIEELEGGEKNGTGFQG